jgi:hypothetical protein
MCSVANTQFQHGEPLGDYERLDVNDLSVRNNLAIEGTGMSPPKMRSAKRIRVAVSEVSLRFKSDVEAAKTGCLGRRC